MEITKFDINSIDTAELPEVSYINAGLMSTEDKRNLESVRDMSDRNISSITVSADTSELNPIIESLNEKLQLQTNEIDRLTKMTESQIYCGRVWGVDQADPKAMAYCGNLGMLQKLPELLGLGCYLVQNDHSRRKLDPNNHYKFLDGSKARLDGSMGHYQWGWNREFYITTWTENDLFYECISFVPLKGKDSYKIPIGSMSAAGFATIDRETDTLVSYINDSPRYRGGNTYSEEWTDEEKVQLYEMPITNRKTSILMTMARNNGTGWFAGSMRMSCVLYVLFNIIMGTRCCSDEYNMYKDKYGLYQGGLGAGASSLFSNDNLIWESYNNINPYIRLSSCIEFGDILGVGNEMSITWKNKSNVDVTKSYKVPIFFGLKNPYNYLWRSSEDEFCIIEDGKIVHYARKVLSGEFTYGDESLCKRLSSTSQVVYFIVDMSYNNLELFPSSTRYGSSSTYYTSIAYFKANKEENTKLFCVRGSSSAYEPGFAIDTRFQISAAYSDTGTYLCEFNNDPFPIEPVNI